MEIERPVRQAVESTAIDDIGNTTSRNEVIHPAPVVGVVFKVRVLDNQNAPRCRLETGLQCAALALIGGVIKNADVDARWRSGFNGLKYRLARARDDLGKPAAAIWKGRPQPLACTIGRTVIDDDDFFRNLGQSRCDGGEEDRQRMPLVEGWNDDGEKHSKLA